MLDDPLAGAGIGLFREDLECFVARVQTGSPSYVSDERVVQVLALVEAIEAKLSAP